jgi:hypothetical protein
MNFKTLLLGVIILGFAAACTQRTCPTYAKDDIKVESAEKVNS